MARWFSVGGLIIKRSYKMSEFKSEMEQYDKITTDELIKLENEIFEEWDKHNTVFSLGEYSEIIRELTIREIQEKQ